MASQLQTCYKKCGLIICILFLLWHFGMLLKIWESRKQESEPKEKDPIDIQAMDQKEKDPIDIQAMDQKDKNLHYYVRSHHIFLPSVLEYSFGKQEIGYAEPEDSKVYPYLNQSGGFFVEVGALDGLYSHTLKLEKDYKWTGLLIECNPEILPKLKSVNRKAYISDVCLSPTTHPVKTRMTSPDKWLGAASLGSGGALFKVPVKSNLTTFEVQTIPLFAILASIDVSQVDFFVLDIQSLELEVLKHFPFDLVLVKVWLIEVYFFSTEQREWLIKFMETNGYPSQRVMKFPSDMIFFHKSTSYNINPTL